MEKSLLPLAILTCTVGASKDHGRLEPLPHDIREGGGEHPGLANKSCSELHPQTESAAHLSDSPLKSGRRLKNWLRREREWVNEESGHIRKINAVWSSGSWPTTLATMIAHITQTTL